MIRAIFSTRLKIKLSKLFIGIILPTFLLTTNNLIPSNIQARELNEQNGKRLEINGIKFHESNEMDSETNSVVNSPIQVISDGPRYFVKADMHDPRVKLRVGLANNDTGGLENLASMKNRYSGQGYLDWAIINGDYFNPVCPNNVNCAEGLTYIDGIHKENWSDYGTTWPVRSNLGIGAGKYMQMAVGDNPQKHMVIAGGPWIVKDGGTPTCFGELVQIGGQTKTYFPATGEYLNNDVRDWCTRSDREYTLVGYSADRRFMYMGVSSNGMNVIELGQWLKNQGAYDVIKLDSGGSSGIYHNNILQEGSSYRAIPNHLALIVDDIPDTPYPETGKWNATYYNGTNFGEQCGFETIEDTFIFKDWGNEKPASGCISDTWSARFTRRIHFDAGSYSFGLFSDDWSKIKIGNDTVVRRWPPDDDQIYQSRLLNEGDYDVTIEFANNTGTAKISAWWWGPGYDVPREAQDPEKWYVQFWGNKDLSWDPIVQKNEEFGPISFKWDEGPGYGLPADGFSSRIEREKVYFDCGSHIFDIKSDDGFRFFIDDQEYLGEWIDGIHIIEDEPIELDTGYHKLSFEHYENRGSAEIYLNWFGNYQCEGIELFDNVYHDVGPKIEYRKEFNGSLPNNFDNITSSIWIGQHWSIRVFDDKNPNGSSEERCIEFRDYTLANDYFKSGTTIDNHISSVEIFNEDTCLLRGDINGDGRVSVGDIIKIIGAYQTSPPENPKADLNFDGRINVQDILIVLNNYPNVSKTTERIGNQNNYLTSEPETSVSILPEKQTKNLGDDFEYSVVMDTNNNLVAGFDLEIKFDPSIFNISSIQEGDGVVGLPTEAINEINNIDGIILYGLSTSDLNNAVQGSNIELMKVFGSIKSDVQIGYCEHNFGIRTITANDEADDVLQETISGNIEIEVTPDICINNNIYLPLSVRNGPQNMITKTIYGEEEDGEALNNPCEVWETCRNASNGTSVWQGLEAGTVGSIFTEHGYMIARSFLFFDTSTIPSNAVLTSATLNLYAGQWQNGNKQFHVVKSSASLPLSNEDFSRIEYVSGGSKTPTSPYIWMQIPLNSTALNWIKPGEITQFALVHDYDFNNITPTEPNDVLIALAENADHKPYLTITYDVP